MPGGFSESWSRVEPGLRKLPGGSTFCIRLRSGAAPWPAVAFAVVYCAGFPDQEFLALAAARDFDVRWPLTFAAWYWGQSSASVDRACATFLGESGLWEKALAALPEYTGGPDWLPTWRSRFERTYATGRPG